MELKTSLRELTWAGVRKLRVLIFSFDTRSVLVVYRTHSVGPRIIALPWGEQEHFVLSSVTRPPHVDDVEQVFSLRWYQSLLQIWPHVDSSHRALLHVGNGSVFALFRMQNKRDTLWTGKITEKTSLGWLAWSRFSRDMAVDEKCVLGSALAPIIRAYRDEFEGYRTDIMSSMVFPKHLLHKKEEEEEEAEQSVYLLILHPQFPDEYNSSVLVKKSGSMISIPYKHSMDYSVTDMIKKMWKKISESNEFRTSSKHPEQYSTLHQAKNDSNTFIYAVRAPSDFEVDKEIYTWTTWKTLISPAILLHHVDEKTFDLVGLLSEEEEEDTNGFSVISKSISTKLYIRPVEHVLALFDHDGKSILIAENHPKPSQGEFNHYYTLPSITVGPHDPVPASSDVERGFNTLLSGKAAYGNVPFEIELSATLKSDISSNICYHVAFLSQYNTAWLAKLESHQQYRLYKWIPWESAKATYPHIVEFVRQGEQTPDWDGPQNLTLQEYNSVLVHMLNNSSLDTALRTRDERIQRNTSQAQAVNLDS